MSAETEREAEPEALFAHLAGLAVREGAFKAAVVKTADIETSPSFRALCEQNLCGNYGKNWMCPPFAGEIDELIDEVYSYEYALVYQTVGMLEDSYDFEGMTEAGKRQNELTSRLGVLLGDEPFSRCLHLGSGGCGVCETCAKREDKPCRHPDKAVSSLETYGINVSSLAKTAGMKYINGQNTVTYFGAALFDL